MSFIGGYQSNVSLSDLNIVGDFPIDHSIGGFGIGLGQNEYTITLNTAITQYRQGLLLQIAFAEANTGAVHVNVSNRGLKFLKKPTPGGLVDLDAGDITTNKIYLLVFDGQGFQVANLGGSNALVVDANEDTKGIAQIATNPEVMAGIDNNKIVTPAKLAAYVANKVTGLWKDKGLIDCSGNPNYPAGVAGEAYTVNVAGKIGGVAGQNVGLRDVIYCNTTNAGGTDAAVGNNWTILQANLEAATEVIAGYIRLASQDEVNTGESLTTAVSPRRLKDMLDARHATEDIFGLMRIATQAEALAGADDTKAITPLKLKGLFDGRQASEDVAGLLGIATQAEVNAGNIDSKALTPLKLAVLLNTLLRFQNGAGEGSIVPRVGAGNSAAAAFAAVFGGQNNRANAPYSSSLGLYADAILFNEWAKSAGAFYNVKGSAQYSVLNLLALIPSGTKAVAITADGNSAGANRWLPPNNSVQQFTVHVAVTQNSGTIGTAGLTWTGVYEGAVRNLNGVMSWVGTEPALIDSHQDPGFTPAISFTFGAGEITLNVTAMIERSLHVSATVHINQVKYSLA